MVVVGGGAGLCGDALVGASQLIKPPHADVANAVGAAIPQVGYNNILLPVLHLCHGPTASNHSKEDG